MALASQVAANQPPPPTLSSPARRLPRASSNALLLLQPAAAVLGGRTALRLRPGGARRALDAVVVARASSEAETAEAGGGGGGAEEERPYEEYEVTIEKPYGLKFTKGRDGGTYVEAIQPGAAADLTGQFEVGDKVLATSSVFGEEIWPAAGYGQTMYCIRQRIGPLYMKMERRFGEKRTQP
jgi:hypothetical protein